MRRIDAMLTVLLTLTLLRLLPLFAIQVII